MTVDEMARLYVVAFPDTRPWSAEEIQDMIDARGGFAVTHDRGFALGRAIAGEAELLTIAVDPVARRQGAGRALLAAFEDEAQRLDADTAFLEVASDNAPAIALYMAQGWSQTGLRKGYYHRTSGAAVDALLMGKLLSPEAL